MCWRDDSSYVRSLPWGHQGSWYGLITLLLVQKSFQFLHMPSLSITVTSLKWPILCRVGLKTLTQSIFPSQNSLLLLLSETVYWHLVDKNVFYEYVRLFVFRLGTICCSSTNYDWPCNSSSRVRIIKFKLLYTSVQTECDLFMCKLFGHSIIKKQLP